jgi:two-component system cell cycle response regulator DivK
MSEIAPSAALGSDRQRLVVVVEDHADSREMYVHCLAMFGFRTAEAGDGQQAIRLAVELRPDLIVTDLSLPGLDGCDLIRRLSADPATRSIPIIALTAHADRASALRARQAGCTAFLAKPCPPDALVAEVNRVLSLGDPERPS